MTFLAKWSGYVMGFYLVLRFSDLLFRGQLGNLFAMDIPSLMCLLELASAPFIRSGSSGATSCAVGR